MLCHTGYTYREGYGFGCASLELLTMCTSCRKTCNRMTWMSDSCSDIHDALSVLKALNSSSCNPHTDNESVDTVCSRNLIHWKMAVMRHWSVLYFSHSDPGSPIDPLSQLYGMDGEHDVNCDADK